MRRSRLRAIVAALVFAIAVAARGVALADDEDPNILGWATIGNPGPQPEIHDSLLEQFLDSSNRPRAAIDGYAQVHYKNGDTVGCQYDNERISVMPQSLYMLWLIKTRTLESRAGKEMSWWGAHPIDPLLSVNPGSVIRRIRCGAWNEPGYFYLGNLPVGNYIVIADIAREYSANNYESGVDYNPYLGENGTYSTNDRTTSSMQWTDSYELFTSVKVPNANVTYHVPPFQVLYHFKVVPR